MNRKSKEYKKFSPYLMLFVVVAIILVVFGLGIALTALSFKNIEFVDDNSIFNLETKEISFLHKDNLVVNSNGIGLDKNYKYVIDNNIEENKIIVSREIDPKYFKLDSHETTMDNMPVINVSEFDNGNIAKFSIKVISDAKPKDNK